MNQGVNATNGIKTMLNKMSRGAICDLRSDPSNFLELKKGLRFLINAFKKINEPGMKKLTKKPIVKITPP